MRRTISKHLKQIMAASLTCAMVMPGTFSGSFAADFNNDGKVYASTTVGVSDTTAGIVTDGSVDIVSDTSVSIETDVAIRIASLHNPISDEVNETVEYSYVYFGEYPQSEISGSALTEEITDAEYDEYNDAMVGDEKYHRIYSRDGYNGYRYFAYEPIRWRVITKQGCEVLLRSDLVLDRRQYNTRSDWLEAGTEYWKDTDLRDWLNSTDTKYGEKGFLASAFTVGELNAINGKIYTENNGVVRSKDKVYLLSGAQLTGLGGVDKTFELVSKASDYAIASGVLADEETRNACWWVRNNRENHVFFVAGYVNEKGVRFNADYGTYNQDRPMTEQDRLDIGVCPAIVLDLEKTDAWCTQEEMQNGFVMERGEEEAYEEYGQITEGIYYYIQDKMLYLCGEGSLDFDGCIFEYVPFQVETTIEEVVIEGSIKEIGDSCFANISRLKKVTMLEGVTTVGDKAFAGCENLEEIVLPSTLKKIGQSVFDDTKFLNNIRESRRMLIINGILVDMNGCSGIITIPDHVTTINKNVLDDASNLLKITIPSTVKKMEDGCFPRTDFISDVRKFFVEEGSIAEEYCQSTFGGGYYVIQADGTSQMIVKESPSPQPTIIPDPVESEQASDKAETSEIPVVTDVWETSAPPETSVPPVTSAPPITSEAVISGDTDLNKKVDLADAQLALKVALKIQELTVAGTMAADVDTDGNVTLKDAQLILKAALKIITLTNTVSDSGVEDSGILAVNNINLKYTADDIAKIIAAGSNWEPFENFFEDTEFALIPTPTPEPSPSWIPKPTGIIEPMKPVIYLYPEETTEIEVKLDFNGDFTFTWPDYREGWKVIAEPDGKLTDTYDGSEHYYLFWEGTSNVQYTFNEGFCVKGEDTAGFLKWALEEQGLTPKEYNDFVTFWVPRMQDNEYNVISFVEDVYTDNAELSFTMEPDTMKRVFMVYYGSDELVDIKEQELTGFEREGFTVVEWGGAEVSSNSYKK